MAITALFRTPFSLSSSSSSLLKRLFFTSHFLPSIIDSPSKLSSPLTPFSNPTIVTIIPKPLTRLFTTSQSNPSSTVNTKVNFTPPGSESDSEPEPDPNPTQKELPPPYDPFSKNPAIEDDPVEDPKNLQEVFHKMRSDGLMSYAAKMFDEMSKDGLTHEALELFKEIKDKGKMPDVVAHTAVIEAYADAGESKEAHKVYLRMLANGVAPNAYTYSVVIKSLAKNNNLGDVKKYVLEMLGKGMMPNARVCGAVFEAFAREGKVEEGRELLGEMKEKGFVVDEKGVREVFKGNRGPFARIVMDILFGKR